MKKRMLFLIVVVCLVLQVCGCGGENESRSVKADDSSVQIENNSGEYPADTFEINKTIYEDDIVTIICKEITKESVVFEATNKVDYDFEWLCLQVSLDGIQLPLYAANSNDQNIMAGETREIDLVGDIGIAEHKKMSLSGNVYIEGSSKGQIDVCDFDLGGNENVPVIEENTQIYDDELVTIYFNRTVINSIEFCVNNKTDHVITVGFWSSDDLIINGKGYYCSAVTINARSKGVYVGYLSSPDGSDVQITELDSLKGKLSIKDQICKDIEDINLDFSIK